MTTYASSTHNNIMLLDGWEAPGSSRKGPEAPGSTLWTASSPAGDVLSSYVRGAVDTVSSSAGDVKFGCSGTSVGGKELGWQREVQVFLHSFIMPYSSLLQISYKKFLTVFVFLQQPSLDNPYYHP